MYIRKILSQQNMVSKDSCWLISEDDEPMCSRCGRWNHHVRKCYAKRDIYGFKIYRPRRERLFGAIKKATR